MKFFSSLQAKRGSTVQVDQAVDWLFRRSGTPVFENVPGEDGRFVPYYDFEQDHVTEADAHTAFGRMCISIRDALNDAMPGGRVLLYGCVGRKDGARGSVYRASVHALVRGVGYCTSVDQVPRIPGCDRMVYRKGARNLFRVPIIASKTLDDDRRLAALDGHTDIRLEDLVTYTATEAMPFSQNQSGEADDASDDSEEEDAVRDTGEGPPRAKRARVEDSVFCDCMENILDEVAPDAVAYHTWFRMLLALRKVVPRDSFTAWAHRFSSKSPFYCSTDKDTLRVIQQVDSMHPDDVVIGKTYIAKRVHALNDSSPLLSQLEDRRHAKFTRGYYLTDFVQEFCALNYPSYQRAYAWVSANAYRVIAPFSSLTQCFAYEQDRRGDARITVHPLRKLRQEMMAQITLTVKVKGKYPVVPLIDLLRDYFNRDAFQYSSVGYYPDHSQCPDLTFNASGDLKAQLLREYARAGTDDKVLQALVSDGLELILTHIATRCAGGNEAYYWYIMSWFYHVCVLRRKTMVVLFLGGLQGAGKSCIPEFVKDFVVGAANGLVANTTGVLTDDFNDIIASREYVVVNEIDHNSMYHGNGTLEKIKGLITGSEFVVNAKFRDKVAVNNNLNFVFTSNLQGSFHLEEHQRRFAPFAVEAHPENSVDYFNQLFAAFDSNTGNRFLTYLHYVVPRHLVPLTPIPTTRLLVEMQQRSMKSTSRFLQYVRYRMATEPEGKEFDNHGWDATVRERRGSVVDFASRRRWLEKRYFHDMYEAFCWKLGLKPVVKNTQNYDFGMAMKKGSAILLPGTPRRAYYDLGTLDLADAELTGSEDYEDLDMAKLTVKHHDFRMGSTRV